MAGGVLSTWSILPGVKKRREPPRPVEFRQPGYEDVFDYDTFFYDVFRDASSRRIIAIGPPLHNFLGTFEQIHVSDGARRLDKTIMLRDRNFQLWIDGARQVEEIVLWHEELTSPKLRITENRCALFDGKRVVVTLSKDNDLTWIADWARFYSVCHGADGVLLYDNGSQRYTIEEIREAILALSPSLAIEIVPWPFRFGARGGTHQRWDSDYCQYGALEHARHKYLRSAASVMSCDIDELVVSASGKSIFEVTETKRRGYTVVTGVIMPNNFDPSAAGPRRFLGLVDKA